MLKMYIDEINRVLDEFKGLVILYSLNDRIYDTLVAYQSELTDLKNSIQTADSEEEERRLKRDARRAIGGFYRFINQIS